MHYLVILLGCQVFQLMEGRVKTALEFTIKLNPDIKVDWYLTGGSKTGQTNSIGRSVATEADKMAHLIEINKKQNWNFIMDNWATNTAENFIHIANNISEYDTVYVVTSAFHQERAAKIMDLIIPANDAKWLLSGAELVDSRYWEGVHMKNVEADVKKAIQKRKSLQ
jgi:uncharacterized SAM-binding protein YcdF (DUF218 family)